MQWVARAVVLVSAALTTACSSYETIARESFADTRSCPIAGVKAVEHPEISGHDLIFGTSKPPADIAADPARLAIWKDKDAKSKKLWDETTKVFLVTGCNESTYYTCSTGAGSKSGRRSCSARSRTP